MFSIPKVCGSLWHQCFVDKASAEEFVVTPYNFEPEYKEGEDSSNLSESEYSDGSDEDVFAPLVTLDWCECLHCTAATLNHPTCPCRKEVAEASALTNANSKLLTCIIHHNNFRAVCLNRAVLKTTLLCIKHLVQGMDFSISELPNEYTAIANMATMAPK